MRITKFGHACLYIQEGEAKILIDPGAFSAGFESLTGLDAILITHQHMDHINPKTFAELIMANKGAAIYADADSQAMLSRDHQIETQLAKHGDSFTVAGVKIDVIGQSHAPIYQDFPGITNTGYMIAERLFVPGDNFTRPERAVEILALPIGAPWLKVSEVINYVLNVKPAVAIPVHDAVLAMPKMHVDMIRKFSDSKGIKLTVIDNGGSFEV